MCHLSLNLLLLAVVSVHGEPSIVSVTPEQGELGLSSEVMITGLSTQFAIPEPWSETIRWVSNIDSIYMSTAQDTLHSVQWRFGDSTHVYATFTIAETNDTGNYNLTVLQKEPPIALELNPAYRVAAPPPPSIQGINPDTGMQGIPIVVTITGINAHFGTNQTGSAPGLLNNVDSVYLQGQNDTMQATGFVPTSANTLKACFNPSQEATAGLYDLVIVQRSPNFRMVLAQKFQLMPYGIPVLVSTSPGSGTAGQSFTLSIAGAFTSFGFPFLQSDGTVNWSNNVDSVILSSGNTVIVANTSIPDNPTNITAQFVSGSDDQLGVYDLIVVQHQPPERLVLSASVRLLHPELLRIDPDSGYLGQLCNVSIIGINTQFGNPEQFCPTMGNVSSVYLRNATDSMRARTWSAFGPGSDTAFSALFAPTYANSPGWYDLVVVERYPPLQIELPDAFRLLPGTTPELTLSPDSGMSGDTISCVLTGSFFGVQINSVVLVSPELSIQSTTTGDASPSEEIVTFSLPEVTEEKSFEVQMHYMNYDFPTEPQSGLMINRNGFRVYPVRKPSATIKQDGCASPGSILNLSVLASNISLADPWPVLMFGGVDWIPEARIEITNGSQSYSAFSLECTNSSEGVCSGILPDTLATGWYTVNIRMRNSDMVFEADNSVYIASGDSCNRTSVISTSVSSGTSTKRPVVSRTRYGYLLNLSALPVGTAVRLFDIQGRTVSCYSSSAGARSVMIKRPGGCVILSIANGKNREITKLAFP
ncbi:MAG: hypothetical protein JW863_16060 [Chitinispirillaceae bacterium]|nr:hypothetical protein [Chitinispirillaceae bacterium]